MEFFGCKCGARNLADHLVKVTVDGYPVHVFQRGIQTAPVPGTRRWEIRGGADGIGLTIGYVWAGTMERAREIARDVVRERYPLLVHGGDLFTVHAETAEVPA